jgi:integrase
MNTVQPIRNKHDIERMKNALNGRDRLLFIFGINSSLRISDLLTIKVKDVRNKDVLTLRERKTGKAKKIRLNNAIQSAIKELTPPNALDTDYLFKSRKGGAISRVQAYRLLTQAAERIGLQTEIGTHTLRKTFAYHAYKAGTDLALLQSVLNHSSQRETLRYIGIEQDDIDDVYISVDL